VQLPRDLPSSSCFVANQKQNLLHLCSEDKWFQKAAFLSQPGRPLKLVLLEYPPALLSEGRQLYVVDQGARLEQRGLPIQGSCWRKYHDKRQWRPPGETNTRESSCCLAAVWHHALLRPIHILAASSFCRARETAVKAVKDKDRGLGLRCLRRHKLWERAGFQCHEYAAKIEELLLQLDQAELTQQVGFRPGLLWSSPLCLKVRPDYAKTGASSSSVPSSCFLLDFCCCSRVP
jgi:hypothetical protein